MRTCPFCGEGFEPRVHNQVYCNPQHRRKQENIRKKVDTLLSSDSPGTIGDLSEAVLLEELSKRGFSVSIEKLAEDRRYTVKIDRFKGGCYKLGAISCSHFGSRYQQLTALREFYKVCGEQEIGTVFHTGDALDGDGTVYKGQIFEMFLQGADPQRDYMVEHYPYEPGVTTKIIGGNHDNSFIQSSNSNVLEKVAERRKDIEYLGEYGAFIDLEMNGTTITSYLMHGGGQSNPYARSYKLQKIVENFTPENKPHIVFLGHWHVGCHLPQYRNVEAFLMGAFQSQTPHLKRLGIWPTTTALILEIYPDDRGIAKIKSEWLHWHIQREKDY